MFAGAQTFSEGEKQKAAALEHQLQVKIWMLLRGTASLSHLLCQCATYIVRLLFASEARSTGWQLQEVNGFLSIASKDAAAAKQDLHSALQQVDTMKENGAPSNPSEPTA